MAKENPVLFRCRNMLSSAKKRAQDKNLEFTLVVEDLLALAQQNRCPISRQPFVWKDTITHGPTKVSINSPTLDRIDPSLGYTPDNVWLISARMNRIKNDATPRELALVSRAVNDEMMRRVCSDF